MTTSAEGVSNDSPASEEKQIELEASELAKLIIDCLDDAKAENVVSINLQGKTEIGDVMIIASGRSHRHVGAIADQLIKHLKNKGLGNARVEGLPHCDWVLIDTGDAIVHLFRPEVREFYNLEKIWSTDHSPSDEG